MTDESRDRPASPFLALHRESIENWLEGAIPGHTLYIHVGTPVTAWPFVSSTGIEMNTVVLALTVTQGDLVGGPWTA